VTNGTATPAPLHFVYDYSGRAGDGSPLAGTATADLVLGPRASLSSAKARDCVVSMMGLPPDSNTAGPMRIEGAGVGQIVARATVTTLVDLADASKGVKGSEFQSYSSSSPEAVGKSATPVAIYPGIQKFAGIRTNMILAEVSGQNASVRVRLVNGTTGGVLAELTRSFAPWERVQLNDIWNGDSGFAIGDAGFDKVAITLEPTGNAPGRIVGALTVIDNNTNSSQILVLSPPGPPSGGAIGF